MEDEYLDNMEREGLILAPIKIRFFAFIIDYLLMFVIVYAIYFNALDGVEDIETMIIIITDATIKGFIIKFIYESFFVYYYSATIGKIVMKIRVLQIESFDNLSLIESIGRSGIKILNEYIFYFGCMFAFMGELKQTLHDRAVKSVVVYA
jgi:uncharacterized RDD family membrane protein YckC